MYREYSYVSPSLEGVLSHASLIYDGVKRPTEIIRAFDRKNPASDPEFVHGVKILEQYFYDLYGIFMKRLSTFVIDTNISDIDSIRLQAMLQEMIKIKKLIAGEKAAQNP